VGGASFNFTQSGGATTVDGTLASSSPGTFALNGGSLDGAGTLSYNVVDDSTLTPGDSAAKTGKLTVSDTYTQGSTGTLDIQINGATAGTRYDQLKVTQAATLGGTLTISLGSGFTPTVGQSFTILTASTVADQFSTVNGLAINGSEHFTITYNAGSVVLTVVSGALPASYSDMALAPHHERHYTLAAVAAPRTDPIFTPGAAWKAQTSISRTLRPREDFGAPAAAPTAGASGLAAVAASAYNSMAAMNHMRFECGVDLRALLKTGRKRLMRGLWAAPDSADALYLGYMAYSVSH
jgi:hypothetical protein